MGLLQPGGELASTSFLVLTGGYLKDAVRLFTEVKRWENEGQWSYIGAGEVLN